METIEALAKGLREIKNKVNREVSIEQEAEHLKKIIWINRFFFIAGYILCFAGINIFSMLFLSIYLSMSWTIVMHHVNHGAYNKAGRSSAYHSSVFAKGWRRYIDWVDWMYPEGWEREHNILHHMHTNEIKDKDQVCYWDDQKTPSKKGAFRNILNILFF